MMPRAVPGDLCGRYHTGNVRSVDFRLVTGARAAPADALDVFRTALKLGLNSFGGPIAHIGYFRDEYVRRRGWVSEVTFADLVALCQFLPGPASSQLGMAIGTLRAGLAGSIAAWLGFTLPSALLLMLFAFGVHDLVPLAGGAIHGLKVVAVAVVALAVWGMAGSLAPDRPRATIAIATAIVVLIVPHAAIQVVAILVAAAVGVIWLKDAGALVASPITSPISRRGGALALALFAALLLGLPLVRAAIDVKGLAVADTYYRVGSLVFGGGHVVLPLLRAEVVPPGWVSDGEFLAGYAAAQAVPGPLFTFAAYLGAIHQAEPRGVAGAMFALVWLFLPGYLLVVGALPFWSALRSMALARAGLRGVNAAVVGILVAALYDPGWRTAILAPRDFAVALACLVALAWWRLPPAVVVVSGAIAGLLFLTP